MQPYRRQMSYDSLKLIVPRLKYGQRLHLSSLSRLILGIHRRSDPLNFSLSFLKFHQTYSNPDCTTGVLFVESVEYSFESIGACHVEIRCLGRKRVSSEKDVARRYFEYFLRTSKLPVQQLELIQCQTPFHNFHDRPIPRLKVHIHQDAEIMDATILGFPKRYKMEMVEFIDCRIVDLEDFNVARADNVIIRGTVDKPLKQQDEEKIFFRYLAAVHEARGCVQSTFELSSCESFANGVMSNMFGEQKTGSTFTGVFDEKVMNAGKLYKHLFKMFKKRPCKRENCPCLSQTNTCRFEIIDGKKCMVIWECDYTRDVVFENYFETEPAKISFTAIRLPRKIRTLPGTDILEFRLLISSRTADEISGFWGVRISCLREKFNALIDITKSGSHEQVLTIVATVDSIKNIMLCIFHRFQQKPPYSADIRFMKFLLHRSQALIFSDFERRKSVISEYLYEAYHYERITVGAACAPDSTDKVLTTYGITADVVLIMQTIGDILRKNPIIGKNVPYQPVEDRRCNFGDYGGFEREGESDD